MKDRIIKAIDENRDAIFACGEYVLNNPELGYKEFKTAKRVQEEFEKLGIPFEAELAVTGVKGVLGNPDADITVCIIGEMDAVKCFDHPFADKETSAAHTCGHNIQIANLIGAAYGIAKSGVLDEINGRVVFFAVPAEEFAELDYRSHLVDTGKITYMAGKHELIHIGAFDDVDIAMMIHAHAQTPKPKMLLCGSSLGFEMKKITYTGKSAHGSEPFNGTNALNAAMLGLMGVHSNRETFKDSDRVRIHPIITNGGELVNVIPDKAVIETYVRAATPEALLDACEKVDNSMMAGALAVGAKCDIQNIRGYAPLMQDEGVSKAFAENTAKFLSDDDILYGIDMTGSTDMGDLSQVMPVIQPTMGGFSGLLHGKDFTVSDKEFTYITASKILALTAYDLLKDNARLGKKIKEDFKK